jgi:hypothetical protein
LFNSLCSWKIVLPKLAAVAGELPIVAKVVHKEGGQTGHYYDLE